MKRLLKSHTAAFAARIYGRTVGWCQAGAQPHWARIYGGGGRDRAGGQKRPCWGFGCGAVHSRGRNLPGMFGRHVQRL